jgi:RNA polymerase sigma factor (sigma-70 family)
MPGPSRPADRRARFDELYRTHYGAVYAYVYRRLNSGASDVPDVVAEVFAVVWRKLDEVPQPPEDRLWLYGVARRRVLGAQRTGGRYLRLQARLREHAQQAVVPADDPDTAVRDAIASLRPGDREVLMLVMWEGLSHGETAEVMGCSVNAVALRVSRAKRRLRSQLKQARPALERQVPEPGGSR